MGHEHPDTCLNPVHRNTTAITTVITTTNNILGNTLGCGHLRPQKLYAEIKWNLRLLHDRFRSWD